MLTMKKVYFKPLAREIKTERLATLCSGSNPGIEGGGLGDEGVHGESKGHYDFIGTEDSVEE